MGAQYHQYPCIPSPFPGMTPCKNVLTSTYRAVAAQRLSRRPGRTCTYTTCQRLRQPRAATLCGAPAWERDVGRLRGARPQTSSTAPPSSPPLPSAGRSASPDRPRELGPPSHPYRRCGYPVPREMAPPSKYLYRYMYTLPGRSACGTCIWLGSTLNDLASRAASNTTRTDRMNPPTPHKRSMG